MKKWYKGNLHSHTVQSDGHLTPVEAVQLYKNQGYDFLCFSEHDHYTDLRKEFDSENFIILPGLEASVCLIGISEEDKQKWNLPYLDGECFSTTWPELRDIIQKGLSVPMIKTHHIHGILGNKEMQKRACENVFDQEEYTPIRVYVNQWNGLEAAQQLSDYLQERGCFTTYNHPIWSRVDTEEVRGIRGVWAIECYNYNTVNECGEGENTSFWDDLLRHQTNINAFASDDNHNNGLFPDSCGGYVMVRADELSHEAIVNSLLAGDYYSSSGAYINEILVDKETIMLKGMNAKKVDIIVGGPVGSSQTMLAKEGRPIENISYDLPKEGFYVRIEIEDFYGKKAWTNAYKRSSV